MSFAERDQLRTHEFDGIHEYDNPLPRWWVFLFWASIVFSALYVPFYHFGPGPLVEDQYNAEMMAYLDLQAEELLKRGPITDATILGMAEEEATMKGAKKTFQTRCSPCHGMFGEGNIGPNLTDDYWLHGGTPTEIYTTITEGVPAKGMLAWKKQLGAGEIIGLSAYVTTLYGTSPVNPKKPEGKIFARSEIQTEEAPAAAEGDAAAAPERTEPDPGAGR